jgi:hypothetical protein
MPTGDDEPLRIPVMNFTGEDAGPYPDWPVAKAASYLVGPTPYGTVAPGPQQTPPMFITNDFDTAPLLVPTMTFNDKPLRGGTGVVQRSNVTNHKPIKTNAVATTISDDSTPLPPRPAW